jgi:AmmeMemoRadiSam system protein A
LGYNGWSIYIKYVFREVKMGQLMGTYLLPHPPIIVPEVGKGQELDAKKTIKSIKEISKEIGKLKPKTVIISSPHCLRFSDFLYIKGNKTIKGNLQFGSNLSFEFENNVDFIKNLIEAANNNNIDCGYLENKVLEKYNFDESLDHGSLVPLYFISKELKDFNIVSISLADFPLKDMYKFGKILSKTIIKEKGDFVYIASGDLSHKVNNKSHYGYSKHGKIFDDYIIDNLKKKNISKVLNIDTDLVENAAQCGLKSITIMLGTLDKYEYDTFLNSYEAPYGIGYGIMSFKNLIYTDDKKDYLEEAKKDYKEKLEIIKKNEHEYVKLARKALNYYVINNNYMKIPLDIDNYLRENKAGVFVSIKKNGELRGCIGTILPCRNSIFEEIIYNAVSAGINDYRFDRIVEEELEHLIISVDILKKPEKIFSIEELDVKRYGVIVKNKFKSGLLLPNLNGIDKPEEQIKIALDKAGIKKDEDFEMKRFEVIRYK